MLAENAGEDDLRSWLYKLGKRNMRSCAYKVEKGYVRYIDKGDLRKTGDIVN